jgi:hypothetical protein
MHSELPREEEPRTQIERCLLEAQSRHGVTAETASLVSPTGAASPIGAGVKGEASPTGAASPIGAGVKGEASPTGAASPYMNSKMLCLRSSRITILE